MSIVKRHFVFVGLNCLTRNSSIVLPCSGNNYPLLLRARVRARNSTSPQAGRRMRYILRCAQKGATHHIGTDMARHIGIEMARQPRLRNYIKALGARYAYAYAGYPYIIKSIGSFLPADLTVVLSCLPALFLFALLHACPAHYYKRLL